MSRFSCDIGSKQTEDGVEIVTLEVVEEDAPSALLIRLTSAEAVDLASALTAMAAFVDRRNARRELAAFGRTAHLRQGPPS